MRAHTSLQYGCYHPSSARVYVQRNLCACANLSTVMMLQAFSHVYGTKFADVFAGVLHGFVTLQESNGSSSSASSRRSAVLWRVTVTAVLGL
jgi:hypothetical protein